MSPQPLISDTLFALCDQLLDCRWKKHLLYTQTETQPGSKSYCYVSANTGPAVWLAAGIHGEEPAGPLAISLAVSNLNAIAAYSPCVVFPLLNPSAFNRGWRYFNEYRDWHLGQSVGDMSHLIYPDTPPNNNYCAQLGSFITHLSQTYPPLLCLDFHEDELVTAGGYVYPLGPKCNSALSHLLSIHTSSGIPQVPTGTQTRFAETIKDGCVWSEPNGSFEDALLQFGCPAVYTLELPTNLPLHNRIATYQKHLQGVNEYLELIK